MTIKTSGDEIDDCHEDDQAKNDLKFDHKLDSGSVDGSQDEESSSGKSPFYPYIVHLQQLRHWLAEADEGQCNAHNLMKKR